MGHEEGNESFTKGAALPWLQDTDQEDVWGTWEVTYRDVIVLDPEGHVHGVFNVTDNDLSIDDNYDALAELLREATQ